MGSMDYIIKKSKKRRKTVEIKMIEGQLIIYAPQKINEYEIEKIYEKYKKRFSSKIKNNDENTVYFLGNRYDMDIKESPLLKIPICEIKNNKFIIFKPKNIDIKTEDVIKEWQKNQAKKIITERIKFFVENYDFKFSFEKNHIRFKNQKTKWGSCSYCNNLNFNYKIMEKSNDIIDYLVVHELSHTIYKNHSNDFWKYVENILPNYKKLRKNLKQ